MKVKVGKYVASMRNTEGAFGATFGFVARDVCYANGNHTVDQSVDVPPYKAYATTTCGCRLRSTR